MECHLHLALFNPYNASNVTSKTSILNSKKMEVLDEFRYLGSSFRKDGSVKAEVKISVFQERKVGGSPRGLVNGKNINIVRARSLHAGALVPALTYGCESQVYVGQDRSKVTALEMDNLCSIVRIRMIDKE